MGKLQPSRPEDYLCAAVWRHRRRHPNKRVRFGKINSKVVAKRMSPAWRIFDCLNMADRLLVVIPEYPLASLSRCGSIAVALLAPELLASCKWIYNQQ
ncbi:hypothetical protein [Pseudomonas sp. TWI929]|uniref:hypothetical protein n=1 Tax=Pseudomonas sp. TWI929 TaxID=3136795 RepID=UPI00320A7D37